MDQRRGGSERKREIPCDRWEGEQKGSIKITQGMGRIRGIGAIKGEGVL